MKTSVISPENFYDEISEFYDEMIDFRSSLQKRKELLNTLLKGRSGNAADLGCGSGMDSITLAFLGFQVTGFDLSEKMIKKAMENASAQSVNIKFMKSSLDKINPKYFGKFDVVLSLGNTIPNLNSQKAEKTTGNIFQMLKPGGLAVIQLLNYSRILSSHERIINIKTVDGHAYIRFYDFLNEYLNFNILSFSLQKPTERQFFSSRIFPYSIIELKEFLMKTGFNKIDFFGSLKLEAFNPKTSPDLVAIIEK